VTSADGADSIQAERIARLVVDKLGQGFLVPGWAWQALQESPGVWQAPLTGSYHGVIVELQVFNERAELILKMHGGQPAWRGTLRPG
jgi:hypothetical protein